MIVIRIAAALLLRPDGQTLLVRKHGTEAFMQPGGKIDAGETAEVALAREIKEELDLAIDPGTFEPLGRFEAVAANEPGHSVLADVFVVRTERMVIHPASEIEEAVWVSPFGPLTMRLAPLTEEHILPHYRRLAERVGEQRER